MIPFAIRNGSCNQLGGRRPVYQVGYKWIGLESIVVAAAAGGGGGLESSITAFCRSQNNNLPPFIQPSLPLCRPEGLTCLRTTYA